MKNLMKLGLFALLGLLIVTTGCEDDDPIDEGPSITIDFGSDFETQTFAPGSDAGPFRLTFTSGDSDLNAIYVRKNGELLDNSEFLVDNQQKAANPFNLTEDQKQEVQFEFNFTLSDEEVTEDYTIEVADVEQNTAFETFELTTAIQGTPVELDSFIVLNNANGQNLGGLDLDADLAENITVSVNNDAADVIDSGIDQSVEPENDWIGTIQSANGGELKTYDGDFASITTKEQIEEEYGNAGATISESGVVEVGDMFLIKTNQDNYSLIIATEVNETNTTDPDTKNDDFYEFAVKR